jgi:hypothetical protein
MTDDEILAYYRHRHPYISRGSAVFGRSCSGPRSSSRRTTEVATYDRPRDAVQGQEKNKREVDGTKQKE